MPRARRNDYPGAWHHVMNRTIDGLALFADDTDRRIFMIELREALKTSQAELHGYCLMSNHYHLLIHTPAGGLSEAMQRSVSAFTQKINFRRGRDGPLFRGRFTSVSPDDDAHLVNISAYIHLNPVKAGLVTAPEDWQWSSAGAYLGSFAPQFDLQTKAILEMLDPTGGTASYQKFVMERFMLGSGP
jgi:putative transposase